MADDRSEAVTVLLARAQEAHHTFEATELNGVFDQDWSRWYAAYAVDHGIGQLIGRVVTTDVLADFLAGSNVDFSQIDPAPDESWAAYTARRITTEL